MEILKFRFSLHMGPNMIESSLSLSLSKILLENFKV